MKKYICVLSVLLGMTIIQAQDTIQYGDSCFLFTPLTSDCHPCTNSINGSLSACVGVALNGGDFKVTHTDNVVAVYGVAATVILNESTPVPDRYTAYLYMDVDTAFVPFDSALAYSTVSNFHYHASKDGIDYDSIVPCVEFYFEKPHMMKGNIYVGIKRKIPAAGGGEGVYNLLHACTANPADRETWGWPPTHSLDLYRNWWGGYFPIVQPERIACTAPVAEVSVRGDDYAVLVWDSVEGGSQLSVVPYGVSPDSGLVVPMTDTTYTVTGLDSGIYYVARLRTECHHQCPIHDTLVWSQWGQPTFFYLGNTEPQLGLRHVEEEPSWTLSPNPARDIATVEAQVPLQKVELMTVKGECLQKQDLAGATHHTFHLKGLADGIYLVRVTTANGTSIRRLVLKCGL